MFSSFLLVCVLLAPPKRSSAHHARTTRRARTHTNTQVSDWLQDRWQAAQDMSGTPIQGPGLARRRPLVMPARVGPYVYWPICVRAHSQARNRDGGGSAGAKRSRYGVLVCVRARPGVRVQGRTGWRWTWSSRPFSPGAGGRAEPLRARALGCRASGVMEIGSSRSFGNAIAALERA